MDGFSCEPIALYFALEIDVSKNFKRNYIDELRMRRLGFRLNLPWLALPVGVLRELDVRSVLPSLRRLPYVLVLENDFFLSPYRVPLGRPERLP